MCRPRRPFRCPGRIVTTSFGSPLALHSPSMSTGLSASGPTTAMERGLPRGARTCSFRAARSTCGHVARRFAVSRREGHLFFTLLVAVAVGIVEESQLVFQPGGCGGRSGRSPFRRPCPPSPALRVNSDSSRPPCRCRIRSLRPAARPVSCPRRRRGDISGHGPPVGDDDAVPAPLAAQDLFHEEAVAGGGTPESSLNEFMKVAAPASAAALNGGR